MSPTAGFESEGVQALDPVCSHCPSCLPRAEGWQWAGRAQLPSGPLLSPTTRLAVPCRWGPLAGLGVRGGRGLLPCTPGPAFQA